jgi:hypothetical protein
VLSIVIFRRRELGRFLGRCRGVLLQVGLHKDLVGKVLWGRNKGNSRVMNARWSYTSPGKNPVQHRGGRDREYFVGRLVVLEYPVRGQEFFVEACEDGAVVVDVDFFVRVNEPEPLEELGLALWKPGKK